MENRNTIPNEIFKEYFHTLTCFVREKTIKFYDVLENIYKKYASEIFFQRFVFKEILK